MVFSGRKALARSYGHHRDEPHRHPGKVEWLAGGVDGAVDRGGVWETIAGQGRCLEKEHSLKQEIVFYIRPRFIAL